MPPYADDKPAYDNGPDALGKLIPDRTLTEVCVCVSVPPHHVTSCRSSFFAIFFHVGRRHGVLIWLTARGQPVHLLALTSSVSLRARARACLCVF